jgi:hypothetical protein
MQHEDIHRLVGRPLVMIGRRSTSIGSSFPSRSKCQKVQPLQEGAFCNSAPTLWIEPRRSPALTLPSGPTTAETRR